MHLQLSDVKTVFKSDKMFFSIFVGAHGRFIPEGLGRIEREARIQTLEPLPWMREVEKYGHGTRKVTPLMKIDR